MEMGDEQIPIDRKIRINIYGTNENHDFSPAQGHHFWRAGNRLHRETPAGLIPKAGCMQKDPGCRVGEHRFGAVDKSSEEPPLLRFDMESDSESSRLRKTCPMRRLVNGSHADRV